MTDQKPDGTNRKMIKRGLQIILLMGCSVLLSACPLKKENGYNGYMEGRFTYVSSQITGTLDTLSVAKGDSVKLNAPLFALDPNPEQAKVKQAKANLAEAIANLKNLQKGQRPTELAAIVAARNQAQAQLTYAQKTFKRYLKLYQAHVLEKAALDQSASNFLNLKAKVAEINENLKTAKLGARSDQVAAARANVKANQAALKQALWQLQQKTITAPVAGEVYDTFYRTGETVPAGSPVLSLLAPENIYAVFYLPETALATVSLDQSVAIHCDSCITSVSAKINFISPSAEYTPPIIYSERSRSKLVFRVEAKLSTDDAMKLHPGQPISITLGNKASS